MTIDAAIPDFELLPPADSPSTVTDAYEDLPLPPTLGRGQLLFRVLGAASIYVGPELEIGPASERMFSLLCVTALAPDHTVARSRLLELVWPDMGEAGARHSLRQHCYRLKQLGVEVDATRARIAMPSGSLAPCFALHRTSVLFDQDVLKGNEPFGHLFAGWIPRHAPLRHWVEQQREAYHAEVRRILVPELRRLRDRAHWHECERWARTLLEFDPYNEDATLILAHALAMTGSRMSSSEVLDTYVRETGGSGTELGKRVEREQARILKSSRVVHDQSASPRLIGRDDVLARLDGLTTRALQGEAQIVQLLGPAGIGKTEVAYEATRRAIILGFARCIVRVSRPVGQIAHGTLSRLTRDLLQLPGALGCSPPNLRLLRQFAGLEPAPRLDSIPQDEPAAPLTECLLELVASLSEERPLFVFIDDLHYVDRQSMAEIQRLLDLLHQQRAIVLTCVRGDLDGDRYVRSCTNRHTIQLTPLAREHSLELAVSVSTASGLKLEREQAERLLAVHASSPLEIITLARELLLTSLSDVPQPDLAHALRRQVERLDSTARTILGILLVLGGRARVVHVDRILDAPLALRVAAIKALLDSGLATEMGTSELGSHEEVIAAADEWFTHTELLIIRRRAVSALRGVLNEAFSSDLAVAVLAMAQDCEDSEQFVNTALDLCPRLSDKGLFNGALRFLERARDTSRLPEQKAHVLEFLVRAAGMAAEWSTVLLNTAHLREIRDRRQSANDDVTLAEIEACIQSQLPAVGREKAQIALQIASSNHLSGVNQLKALRLAISASADLFSAQLAISAYTLLQRLSKSNDYEYLELIEPNMQHHTIFGDLDEAERLADELHGARVALLARPDGARLLNNAAHVLRVCGRGDAARECMTTASQHQSVRESATMQATAYWRLSLIETDLGETGSAIKSAKKLFALTNSVPELNQDSWCSLYQLRIEHLETGKIGDYSLACEHASDGGASITRLQVHSTAIALHGSLLAEDATTLVQLLPHAVDYLVDVGRYTGQDYLADAVVAGLVRQGKSMQARQLLRDYLKRDRREKSLFAGKFRQLHESTIKIVSELE